MQAFNMYYKMIISEYDEMACNSKFLSKSLMLFTTMWHKCD